MTLPRINAIGKEEHKSASLGTFGNAPISASSRLLMNLDMHFQVTGLRKLFMANFAYVRLLACVDAAKKRQ
jgi:hypothetical protein